MGYNVRVQFLYCHGMADWLYCKCRFESCPDYFYELLDVRKMLFTKKIKRGYIFSIACTLEKLVLA